MLAFVFGMTVAPPNLEVTGDYRLKVSSTCLFRSPGHPREEEQSR